MSACGDLQSGDCVKHGTVCGLGRAAGAVLSDPDDGATCTFAPKHALEILYTGGFITAGRAEAIGLVNHVVTDGYLEAVTPALAGHSMAATMLSADAETGIADFLAKESLPDWTGG